VDSETNQWTYESTITADAKGEFSVDPYFIVQLRQLGALFHVTAMGAQSSMQAAVEFTDAGINKVTVVGAQTPSPVVPGNSVSYGNTAANSVNDIQWQQQHLLCHSKRFGSSCWGYSYVHAEFIFIDWRPDELTAHRRYHDRYCSRHI